VIARFQVLLPYPLYLPSQPQLGTFEIDNGPYKVRVSPPQQAVVDPRAFDGTSPVPLSEAADDVRANPDPVITPQVTLDGFAAVKANLLVIDFIKDDFDRSRDSDDPPESLAIAVANDVLARIRYVVRGPNVKPLLAGGTPWQIEYLNDDGSELQPAPPLIRRRLAGATTWEITAITQAAWEAVPQVPELPVWDSLLLDAFSYLPSVEASIVLAFTALEAFIDWVLQEHVNAGAMDPTLYRWIANRDDHAKEPSVQEQFDVLLKAVSKRTLKDDQRLWESLVSLRKVRNAIAHTGIPTIDKTVVDSVKASQLVNTSREIIDWVELGLPDDRRRRLLTVPVQLEMTKVLVVPTGSSDVAASGSTMSTTAPPEGPGSVAKGVEMAKAGTYLVENVGHAWPLIIVVNDAGVRAFAPEDADYGGEIKGAESFRVAFRPEAPEVFNLVRYDATGADVGMVAYRPCRVFGSRSAGPA
jgi:hypothetical protein